MQGTYDLDVPAWKVLLDAVVDEARHEDLARGLGKPAEVGKLIVESFILTAVINRGMIRPMLQHYYPAEASAEAELVEICSIQLTEQ